MQLQEGQLQTLGQVIRSVTEAESKRYFKSEKNTEDRAELVFGLILTSINLALYDAGIPADEIAANVDATDVVLDQLEKDGYKVNRASILGDCWDDEDDDILNDVLDLSETVSLDEADERLFPGEGADEEIPVDEQLEVGGLAHPYGFDPQYRVVGRDIGRMSMAQEAEKFDREHPNSEL